MRPLPTHHHRFPERAIDRGTVRRFMSSAAHPIDCQQPLERAQAAMRTHQVEQLPVLCKGKLAGIITERAAYTAPTESPMTTLVVEHAMTRDVYTVGPNEPISEVARAMVRGGFGCAVVVDGATICGVFTTTDALRALVQLALKAEA
ncbi:MAG: CBS domain-containing protein [Polyangiaceae bacterium]